ncbi:carbohydrate kinase [Microbacterium sp. No. 7]|nr:carbohydrate kinase [Microbacterium sp. No. 7]
MDAMTHALIVGEALIDIVESPEGTRELVGGSPANVAVGVARQGVPTRLLTRIGRDARGERIAAQVRSSGSELADASWTDAATSTAHARLRADGSAEYVFEIDGTLAEPDVADARLVHTGSIALFLEPGGSTALEALRRAAGTALVSVDPNIRPALVGPRESARERFRQAAAVADIVKLSDEDAEWLYPGVAPEDVLAEIAGLGPRLAVVTRGGEGAIGIGPGGIRRVAPLTVEVVDTIGAGDAYMASLIASALTDDELFSSPDAFERALRRAAVMAGITVSRAGANPPTRDEVDAAITAHA